MTDDKDAGQKDAGRANRRREQIIEAAYSVFASKGFATTTIADVAQALGLGHGTIYRYFENKHDLFMAVIGVILERVGRTIIAAGSTHAATWTEYRAQVERMGVGLIELLNNDPAIGKVLFYESMGISAELDNRIQRAWEAMGTVTAAYLRNGKARGFLRADLDEQATALAIHALMIEAGRQILSASDREAAQTRWLKAIVSLIFEGVRGPSV